MKKIIALTVFALLASVPVARSESAVTPELRATDFSSLKEVDPKPQDKSKTGQLRKGKGGPSSGAGEVMIKEVDPAPQGKLKGMRSGKGKSGPSSGADEVGFNPQPDPPGIRQEKTQQEDVGRGQSAGRRQVSARAAHEFAAPGYATAQRAEFGWRSRRASALNDQVKAYPGLDAGVGRLCFYSRTTSTEHFAYRTTWPALEPRK